MALELFLRLDGVTGSARSFAHRGWCEVNAWHWDLERHGDATSMNRIALVKPAGLESPALIRLFTEQVVVKRAQIDAVPVVGHREAAQKYLEISLEDVTVERIEARGSSEDKTSTETLTLGFAKVHYEFYQHIPATQSGGAASAESLAFSWDIVANSPYCPGAADTVTG